MSRATRLAIGVLVAILFRTIWSMAAETNAPVASGIPAVSTTNAPTPKLPDGIDAKQTSDDLNYGYTKENPVKLGSPDKFGGPAMSEVYLRHLRDSHYKSFTFDRDGSIGGGTDGHILDLYTLVDSDGKKHHVYIDMYHPESTPLKSKAPKGMYFWNNSDEARSVPPPPLPPSDVQVRLLLDSGKPLADGKSEIVVKAKFTDKSGTPIAKANARFFIDGYTSLDGKVLGADENMEIGVSYGVLDSGGYVLPEGNLSNLSDALSNENGEASAVFRVPLWESFMEFKPIRIGVWYDVDGGGNPHDSKLIYFSQAHQEASTTVTGSREVPEVSSPPAGAATRSQSGSPAELRARAEEGDAEAQFALGMAYHEGTSVAKDEVEAVIWFRTAAEQGHADAQFFLGGMCYSGAGVEKDDVEAFKWFLLASRQGDPLASLPLKQLSDSMPPAMIEEAKRRADAFRVRGPVKAGDAQAQHDAFVELKAQAEKGNPVAQSNLGVAYADGKGVGKDDAEAAKWYRKAAEQGFALAQIRLSAMYSVGRGVPKDEHESALWLRKAAEQGLPIAQHYLGLMYGAGQGVEGDAIEAYKWLCLAAAQGFEESEKFRKILSQNLSPAQLEEGNRRVAAWRPSAGGK